MGSDKDGHEMGNLASAKAYEANSPGQYSPPGEFDSKRSRRDYEDAQQLARLGKKSVLKRNFGAMTILGFSCTVLITWEASILLFTQGFQNGGTAGVIYSFLFVWFGNATVFSTLSELASMAPTSGGQYHWVSMLAPRSCSKFLSYLTGWLAVGGWQGAVASGGFLTGTMIQGLIGLTVESYEPKAWHGTLLFWAVIFFAVTINAIVSSLLPKFEGLILILHVLGFFAILIPMVVLGPHGNAHDIFTAFNNGGLFPTDGLSFFVGMMGNVFAFVGVDAAFHMSEETTNPSVVVPRSVMLSLLINGTTGFIMVISVLLCMGDLEKAVGSKVGGIGFPFMEIFRQATNSTTGAAVMASIIVTLACCATVGLLASTSRVFWSFARDRGLPFWRTLSKVDARTSVPLWSIAVTTVISCLLSLINLGTPVAFNNIVSLSVSGLYASYFIACSLLLYRRTTSGFGLPDTRATDLPATAPGTGSELIWGPWHVPGVWGIINNSLACCYLIIVFFFSFWPTSYSVDYKTMNYCIVVTGAITIFSVLYYWLWARREYQGPIVEVME